MSANRVASSTAGRDRLAMIGVTVVGMAICAPGIGRVATAGQWLSFPGIAGTLLGVVILGVVAARLLGKGVGPISTDRQATALVLAVAVLKVAIAALTM